MSVCAHTLVCIRVCAYVCVFWLVLVFVLVFFSVFVCNLACASVIGICVCFGVCVCACVCVYFRGYACSFGACVCRCVSMCVCQSLGEQCATVPHKELCEPLCFVLFVHISARWGNQLTLLHSALNSLIFNILFPCCHRD